MKNYFLIIFIFCWKIAAIAQDRPEQPIPQLLQQLGVNRNDSASLHLILTIADAYILKPGSEKPDLDSASLLISQVEKANAALKDPRIRGLCLLFNAKLTREKGNRDRAKAYALQAVDLFRKYKTQYPAELAHADLEATNYYSYEDEKEDSQRIQLYREAVPLFDLTGRKEMEAQTLLMMADGLGSTSSDGLLILPYLLQSLKIFRSIGYYDLRYLYALLGRSYGEIGDHQHALQYGLLALKIEDSLPLNAARYMTYNRVGLIYFHMGDFPNAILYMHRGLEAAEHFHDSNAVQQAVLNLANVWLAKGKYDSAGKIVGQYSRHYPFTNPFYHSSLLAINCNFFSHARQLPAARTIARQLVSIDSAAPADDFLRAVIEPAIVRYLLTAKEYDRSREYSRRFLDFSRLQNLAIRLPDAYRWLYQADSAQGRWELAFLGHQQFVRVRDSLLDVDKRKQLAALQIEYETEKKDHDIQSLTQKQQLSQLALNQANITRNLIIAGSAILFLLFLIMLLIAVNRYRLKQRTNSQLTRLLAEKEWLLKEIHHRVKNNLQIVVSLLNTQSKFLNNDQAAAAITESRHRMQAMSLIHQKLYQSDNVTFVHMQSYVRELVEYLEYSFGTDRKNRFILDVDEIELDISQAIPVGLILNEAITNCIKHAFTDKQEGQIEVRMKMSPGKQILLEIQDNGKGLPAGYDLAASGSMGIRLIMGLIKQIKGRLTTGNEHGFLISTVFQQDLALKTVAV